MVHTRIAHLSDGNSNSSIGSSSRCAVNSLWFNDNIHSIILCEICWKCVCLCEYGEGGAWGQSERQLCIGISKTTVIIYFLCIHSLALTHPYFVVTHRS